MYEINTTNHIGAIEYCNGNLQLQFEATEKFLQIIT